MSGMDTAQEDLRGRLLIDKEVDVSLESISYKYRAKEDLYIATGDVVLSSGAITLSAQKAEYNLKTKEAIVSGGMRVVPSIFLIRQALSMMRAYSLRRII
jgi:lipopolysaccharide assembly outer membrane protein LptD (OstA)